MTGPILVAFDGSETAQRAVMFATNCARSHKLPIKLVAVVEWQLFGIQNPLELEATEADVAAQVERFRSEVLAPRCAELKAAGIDADFQVETGAVATTIARVAQECGASQIVVGRFGHSKLTELLLGSVASALLHAAVVPVTVVP